MPVMAGWEIDELQEEEEQKARWDAVNRLRELSEADMQKPENKMECFKECHAFCYERWTGSTQEAMLAEIGKNFGLVFSEPFLNENCEVCMYIYDKTQSGVDYVMGLNLGRQHFLSMDIFLEIRAKLTTNADDLETGGRKTLINLVDDYIEDRDNWANRIRYVLKGERTIQFPLDAEQIPRIAAAYNYDMNALSDDFKEMTERWLDCAEYFKNGINFETNSALLGDPEPFSCSRRWQAKSVVIESTYHKREQQALKEAVDSLKRRM